LEILPVHCTHRNTHSGTYTRHVSQQTDRNTAVTALNVTGIPVGVGLSFDLFNASCSKQLLLEGFSAVLV